VIDEFEVDELLEYIRTGMRVAKKEGIDEDTFQTKAIQSLLPRHLDLDDALEKVRQVAIKMGIVEDEE
jgi:hypothetical protein